jgi:hypothetical protein
MSDPLLTIVDELQKEIDAAYAVAVAVEGLKRAATCLGPRGNRETRV